MANKSHGCVHLVNAGPCDIVFLTRQGEEVLKRADVVLCDPAVSTEVLRLAPQQAEGIAVDEWLSRQGKSREKLADYMAKKAQAGKQVIHLSGGAVSGQLAEAIARKGVPMQLVPGVSLPEALARIAGIPLLHESLSRGYTLLVEPDASQVATAWSRGSSLLGTLVVDTHLDRVAGIVDALLHSGHAGDTPAALIQWGLSAPRKVRWAQLADFSPPEHDPDPMTRVVLVVGEVVRLGAAISGSIPRSLAGQTVVVTRARDQAEQLARALRDRGSEVLQIPVIKIGQPTETMPLAEALVGLNGYDWIVFTSVNGVAQFFHYFFKRFKDMRDIGGVRIAAVGPGTAERIAELHLQVDVIPVDFTATHVAKAMGEFESMQNRRVLLLRAEAANPDLPKHLEELGAIVDDVACYRTEGETSGSERESAQLQAQGADWVTFTSGSTVNHFHSRFDLRALRDKFPGLRIASIGPETSHALNMLGITPQIEAQPHTIEGLVTAIESAVATAR
jgi:uroporphyrinogen III methyltransferase / synthase